MMFTKTFGKKSKRFSITGSDNGSSHVPITHQVPGVSSANPHVHGLTVFKQVHHLGSIDSLVGFNISGNRIWRHFCGDIVRSPSIVLKNAAGSANACASRDGLQI